MLAIQFFTRSLLIVSLVSGQMLGTPYTNTDNAGNDVQVQTAGTNATISLNPAITYQTMVGWEGVDTVGETDFPSQFQAWRDKALDASVELGINRIRLETKAGAENPVDYFSQFINGQVSLSTWKSHWYDAVNDNSDSSSINQAGYKFSLLDFKIDQIVLPLKQKLEAKGEKLFVNLEYVTGDGNNGGPAPLHSSNPNEYAEFILAHFKHMESKYGWVPDQVEICNEPVLARGWSATIVANCLVATAKLLNANGFDPDFAAPSCIDVGGAIDWFNQMRQNVPAVLNYMTEFSYHRYGGETLTNIQTIGTFPAKYGVRTAMLEKFDGGGTYIALHEDLKHGQNSAWEQFALAFPTDDNGAQYFWININNPSVVNIGSRTKFLRQYFKFIRAGARRIEASTSNPAFDPLSFINTNQGWVVVVKADQAGSMAINGLPAGTYGIKYTTSSQYNVDLPAVTIAAGQSLVTSIPAIGVITVYAQSGSTGNRVPAANAGSDQTVSPGALVTLQGSGSDPDGDAVTYAWSQVSGPTVSLQGASTTTCKFTAPSVTADTTLSFRLTVNDGKGGTGTDTVNVLVHPSTTANRPPTANAGTDQTVSSGAAVTLQGSASDPDGDAVTYAWSQVGGPTVALTGAATSSARFTAPSVTVVTSLAFRLTVNDGKGGTASDDVNVTVNPSSSVNTPPTANAGPNQTVTAGASVTLQGSGSDANGDVLAYGWSQLSGPAVTLTGGATSTARFTAPSVTATTALTFRLTVSDGKGGSATDDVSVTVNPGGTGFLSGSMAASPSSVNLTAEGTHDWAHWGLTSPGSFDHKAGVNSQISNYTVIGSASALRQLQSPTTYSWTSGTPTASVTSTDTGVYVIGTGAGFRITLPADTTRRTLKLYVGVWDAHGKLEASLSDNSAQTVSDTSLINQTNTSNGVYTLTYQAGSAGQTLTINWTVQATYHTYGNITLQAGTLTGAGSAVNQPPVVNAGPDHTITLPGSASLSGTVSDDKLPDPPGAVSLSWSKVSGPGTVTFSSPSTTNTTAAFSAAGVYVLRLTANDSLLSSSDDVQVTAGSGSSVNTPPTADAGPDKTVLSGSSVSLTGSGTDADNDPLSFAWSQTSGPAVTLSGANTATATFVAPVVSKDAYLTFRLRVTDVKNASGTDDVRVKVRRNRSRVVSPATLNGIDPLIEGSFIGVAVLNASTQADTVEIAAVAGDGIEQVVKSSVFAPQAQEAFLADSVTRDRTDAVSLRAEADNTDVRGFFLIGRGTPNQMDGIGGELEEATELFFPVARTNRSERMFYFLTNTDSAVSASVSVEMLDQAGQVISSGTLALAPGASSLTSLSSLVGAAAAAGDHYLRVTSNVPVQGFELMADSDDFSSAAAQSSTSVRTLWVPHFVLGPAGEDTELRLINPGSQAAEAHFKVYDDQAVLLGDHSVSIPARGMSVSLLSTILGLNAVPKGKPFVTGHIVVDVVSPADGAASLIGTATFTGTAGRAKSTLPMWRQPSSQTVYLHVAESLAHNVFTGLAVMNPNTTGVDVTIRAWNKEGVATAEKTVRVEAGQRIVDLLKGSRVFGPAFDQIGGHLEVSSDQPVVSFVVFGDGGSQFLAAVEGQANQ